MVQEASGRLCSRDVQESKNATAQAAGPQGHLGFASLRFLGNWPVARELGKQRQRLQHVFLPVNLSLGRPGGLGV